MSCVGGDLRAELVPGAVELGGRVEKGDGGHGSGTCSTMNCSNMWISKWPQTLGMGVAARVLQDFSLARHRAQQRVEE